MVRDVEKSETSKIVAEVTVGSVTICIYSSPNCFSVKKSTTAADGTQVVTTELTTYESFVVAYYEGSFRKTTRRSTLDKAKKVATEVATRLNRDGAKAEFISDQDRRIFILVKKSLGDTGMEVDEACRKIVELQKRLKVGSLEEAVNFKNDYGVKLKIGVSSREVFDIYLKDLKKRGVGDYHDEGSFCLQYRGQPSLAICLKCSANSFFSVRSGVRPRILGLPMPNRPT